MKPSVRFINGNPVKIEENTNQPFDSDIFKIVGLPNSTCKGPLFFNLLCNEKYTNALELVAYCDDILIEIARKRIARYLLIRLGCWIEWMSCTSVEQMKEFDFCVKSFKGITNILYSHEHIIQLVNQEGFKIEYIELEGDEVNDRPNFSLQVRNKQ